jgi:type 1 glutamine amidotransferase/sugar phosphate isomerase/epimerase
MKTHFFLTTILLSVLPSIGAESFVKNADERAKIEQAIPAEAIVQPTKSRRLLIFTLNVGYGGHPSISHANEAFTLMGKRTGAFETIVSNNPAVFQRDSLNQFDAVFFNNTVGNCFTNADLRQNLLEFVTGGGGLMGVHGTSVGFTRWPGAIEDWPEFGLMIGARGAAHKESNEHVWIKLDARDHPLNRVFGGQDFDYRDEFLRFGEPYSRQRVRVLLSIDTAKTDVRAGQPRGDIIRADNDYALAWVRNYGQGRVFYSTIAHNPHVFWDAKMLQFYLGAIQFALGDLPAPTTPSAKLTPAVRAQEKLGWRLGIEAYTFHKFTFFETIEKTAQLGLPYIGGLSFQKVSQDIPKNFEPQLSDDELRQIRLKLESAGVRLLTFYIQDIPNDEAACRKIFEFGRKMGIETFMSEPKLEALPLIDKFCNEYGINVSLHNHDQKASPQYWNPEGVLKACQDRSKRIGACGDLGYWMRSGIDPIQAIRTLKDRLLTVQMHDLHATGNDGHDVPWGTGVGKSEEFFRELHRLGIKPTMIGLEYSYDWLESLPKVAQCKEFFDATTLKLAP